MAPDKDLDALGWKHDDSDHVTVLFVGKKGAEAMSRQLSEPAPPPSKSSESDEVAPPLTDPFAEIRSLLESAASRRDPAEAVRLLSTLEAELKDLVGLAQTYGSDAELAREALTDESDG